MIGKIKLLLFSLLPLHPSLSFLRKQEYLLKTIKIPAFAGMTALLLLLLAQPALAYERAEYKARPHLVPNVTMQLGETKTVTVKFVNIGPAIWNNDNENFVSVYTLQEKYRESIFADSSWISPEQPTKMKNTNVFLARVGIFEFKLRAPNKTGTYTEHFGIAAEDKAWIDGGEFALNITVANPPKETKQIIAKQAAPKVEAKPKAQIIAVSKKKVSTVGGKTIAIRAFVKNTGDAPWNIREVKAGSGIRVATVVPGHQFADASWVNTLTPLRIASGVVSPGKVDSLTFRLKTPATKGDYVAKFSLMADGVNAEGGDITLPITVTEDAPETQVPTKFTGTEQLGTEPQIRIGLFKQEGAVQFQGTSPYVIKNSDGGVLGTLATNAPISLSYNESTGNYRAVGSGLNIQSKKYLRLEPKNNNPATIFILPEREHRVSWNKSLNYNKFHGTFEMRYSDDNDTTWAINELPFEYYIKGLAETSNNQPEEFLKALVTAARTYAYYHMQSGLERGLRDASLKHQDRHFHLDAKYDQVYYGAERETSFTKVNAAVDATRGVIVLYGADIAITPYYTRSDGRTRANSEVWGVERAWLQSVKTHYDAGKSMLGHGVGMSLQDAIQRADKEAVDYQTLLKYYYAGVDVVRKWK
jgi:hypothetical protein